ncbi:MAG: hypothetical protein PVG83_08750 [Acidimicrobiia bacterium]|jgi:hypothetical protein
MRIRTFSVLIALVLVVAACSPGGAVDETTTSTQEPETSTTEQAVEAPEPMRLSYSLQAGDAYRFEVDLDQSIDLTATGDAQALGEEEIPGNMSVTLSGSSVFDYSIADGPEPGTYAITITGDFSSLELSGTVDGEPVTAEDIPDFANMEPIDVTVIVDEQGNVIPDDSGLEDDLLGFGGLDMLDELGTGGASGQFIGPPFTEDEVTVGDTWSETIETPAMPGDDPITTQIDSEVVGTETIDGHEVFVVETRSTTSPIEFDLGELLAGFMTAFLPEDASDEELAEVSELVSQIRFAIGVDETVSDLTTWFDYEAGLARRADFVNSTHVVMDINVPDETTNELIAFGMDMSIGQNISYRLTDAPST